MIELKPGDIFVSENPSAILRFCIGHAQKVLSMDGRAKYGHAGIIVDSEGKTFESGIHIEGMVGMRIGYQNLFENYNGMEVMILRHEKMTEKLFRASFIPIAVEYNKKVYPAWRLPLMLTPILARKLHFTNLGVCSEIAAKLLYNAELVPQWLSVFPDMLADWGHPVWGMKYFNIAWEGVVNAGNS